MAGENSCRKKVFHDNYEKLMEYVRTGKHYNFPGSKCQEARRLSNWMHRQFKRTTVPDDEKAKLDELRCHFDDSPRAVQAFKLYMKHVKLLQEYKEEYNTFVISKKDQTHKKLYTWAAHQRNAAKKKQLPEERLQALKEIGYLPWIKRRKYPSAFCELLSGSKCHQLEIIQDTIVRSSLCSRYHSRD